ncbi:gamma-glutamylcyclotransferase family protein [Pelagicoccus sp. SDUM812002]|uniref:gamma-glutamylcyclotransferase family protein n=1 Tax=Pelagicoccus sp. SDUM812002 TaxID=3041266 RepID=UPI00280D685B|nr:gamma-glutamylcyclotransferase family protein [Pelagicoccus sp. SDUM812002]MDQ8186514.1 gamma-glutamylcyclotransferase [Pelagicoccus sp. SDUM812002]
MTTSKMSTHYLFTYGTLKSDQPEHAQHCLPPLSITPALACGDLWRLREGYPILQVEPELALLDASKDLLADWLAALETESKVTPPELDGKWIEGQLFEFPLEADSLKKMDAWENFIPGVKSVYQRRIIWVKDSDGTDRIAWAYVCYSPPNWATLLDETSW